MKGVQRRHRPQRREKNHTALPLNMSLASRCEEKTGTGRGDRGIRRGERGGGSIEGWCRS